MGVGCQHFDLSPQTLSVQHLLTDVILLSFHKPHSLAQTYITVSFHSIRTVSFGSTLKYLILNIAFSRLQHPPFRSLAAFQHSQRQASLVCIYLLASVSLINIVYPSKNTMAFFQQQQSRLHRQPAYGLQRHQQPTTSPTHSDPSSPTSPTAPSNNSHVSVDWADASEYLSSDLDIDIDISFASTMSITSAPNSPTRTAADLFGGPATKIGSSNTRIPLERRSSDGTNGNASFSLASDQSMMDISPVQPLRKQHPVRIEQPFLGPTTTSTSSNHPVNSSKSTTEAAVFNPTTLGKKSLLAHGQEQEQEQVIYNPPSSPSPRTFGQEVGNVFSASPLPLSKPANAKASLAIGGNRPRSRTSAGIALPPIRGPTFERSTTTTTLQAGTQKSTITSANVFGSTNNQSGTGPRETSGANAGRARAALPDMWFHQQAPSDMPSVVETRPAKRSGTLFSVRALLYLF